MKIRALFSLLVGLASLHGESPGGGEEAARFKAAFVTAIRDAKTIRATEHSYRGDLSAADAKAPELVYKTVELSPELKAKLLATAQEMAVTPLSDPKRCFSPHHSLKFTDAAGKTRVMEICFSCERVGWAERIPAAFFPAMQKFLEDQGFHADRDWRALAAGKKTGDSGAKKQE
jgi:hypothetical protein